MKLDREDICHRQHDSLKRTIWLLFLRRVYKSYDPRAKILKKLAAEVFDIMGKNPLIDVAVELERIALHDGTFFESFCLVFKDA